MTRLLLVRHGQTAWNRVERFRGQADLPLDEVGLAQAALTGEYIAALWQPTAVYASPLSRAVQTAAAIARPWGLTVQPHPGLLDIDYGAWAGLTPAEVAARWPAELADWHERPHLARIPGGEALAELQARGLAAVQEVVARHPTETVVLVGHTVMNRVLILSLLGLGLEHFWQLGQEPCALNVLALEDQRWVLSLLNETLHLQTGRKATG